MQLFIRLCVQFVNGYIVRRVAVLQIILVSVSVFVHFTHGSLNEQQRSTKCSKNDLRLIYPFCMMRDSILWCDQSAYTKIPTTDEINSHLGKNDCRISKRLYINDSCVSDISEGDLSEFTNLEILVVKNNNIRQLRKEIFSGNKQLFKLDICINIISGIDKDAFKGLHKLSVLNLAENEIQELHARTFHSLVDLTELTLDHNFLATLEHNLFIRLKKLKVLRLRGNRISHVGHLIMRSLHGLTHLHLDGNRIKHIRSDAFRSLKRLEVLTLSHNSLLVWPERNGKILVNLHSLDLAHNSISEFTSNYLVNMSKLQNLSLENNSLTIVEETLFQKTPRLGHLNLAHNYLLDVPKRTFISLCHLRHLVLDGNQLKSARKAWFETMLKTFGNTSHISMEDNSWECGCVTVEYWRFVKEQKSNNPETTSIANLDIRCEFPKKLVGTRLSDIIYEDGLDFDGCSHTTSLSSPFFKPPTIKPDTTPATTYDSLSSSSLNCTPPKFDIRSMVRPYAVRDEREPYSIHPKNADLSFGNFLTTFLILVFVALAVIVIVVAVVLKKKQVIICQKQNSPSSRDDSIFVKNDGDAA